MKKLFFLLIITLLLISSLIIAETDYVSTEDPEIGEYPSPESQPIIQSIDKEITTEQSIDKELGLTNKDSKGKNIHIFRKGNTSTQITFNQGGEVVLNQQTYSDLKPLNDKSPQIYVNSKGEIDKAFFTTSKKMTIILGNEILKDLPAGTKVSYENGEATIVQPKGTNIQPPKETIDNEIGKSFFYYEFEGGDSFILPNGDIFQGKQIGHKNNKLFFDCTEAKIGKDIQIKNPNKVKTYLDFDGKINTDYPGAYISLDRTKGSAAFGMNKIQGNSPAYLINADSDFAKDLQGESDNLVLQTYSTKGESSFVYLKDRSSAKKTARIVTLNGFKLNTDGKSPYFNVEKQKLLVKVKGNLISEFQGSSSYLPFQLESYKSVNNDYSNLVNVFQEKNVMVIGDDGRMAVGSDPGYIPVKSDSYSAEFNEPGLYKGVSHWLAYNEPPTARNFKRFTGVTLNDYVGAPPERIKMLMDVFGNAPRRMIKSAKILNIVERGGFWPFEWAGLAEGGGEMSLSWGGGGLDPGTAIHELTHLHDFEVGYSGGTSNFDKQWNSIGGSEGPHTYDYGYTQGEDTSTFAQYMYYPESYWKGVLSEDYEYHDKFRGRIAVFVWNNFMTREQADRILSSVGMRADDATLEKIFKDAQESYRSRG